MALHNLDPRQRAWVEVFPKAIEANTRKIRNFISEKCLLMAVVKADGYGHGSVTVAEAALDGGAENLGVATLQEALDLRKAGIVCPILVLGNLFNSQDLDIALDKDLMITLSNAKEALLCQKLAELQNNYFNVHIKIDTGMTRLGCDSESALELVELVDSLPNICLKGIYSHLALADYEQNSYAERVTISQKEKFQELLSNLEFRQSPLCKHLANSAGTLRDKGLHFDMVRVGLSLYGYSPFVRLKNFLSLEPALAVRARVTLIRDVPSETGVSYGHTFKTKRPSRLAVVGVGYADGINRALSGKISVLIDGNYYPQVGSITMDQLVIDLTDKPDVQVGSIVTLLGKDGDSSISPYQWSEVIGSIPWEILCGFKYRLPRVVI